MSEIVIHSAAAFAADWRRALADWDAARSTDRLWAKDPTVWTDQGEQRWLGWLDCATTPQDRLDALARQVRAATPPLAREALLVGMGGSSLAPDVISRTLPRAARGCTLRILDSTEPGVVRDALQRTDWEQTVLIVASKSGSTLEADVLFDAAFAAARDALGPVAVRHVIAITDPSSPLDAQARELGASVIAGEPTIGGRYSALSVFGLVPLVLMGHDPLRFLESARGMLHACRAPAGRNPAVQLGAFMARAAQLGRDKCTFLLPSTLLPLGVWLEQLISESTGKREVGIIPVTDEPAHDDARFGDDRAFVVVRDDSAPITTAREETRVIEGGHPLAIVTVPGAHALAGEFLRWELSAAIAGAILGVNPFDQPDVEASKVATREITSALEAGEPVLADDDDVGGVPSMVIRSDAPPAGLIEVLRTLFSNTHGGDYVAMLAFLPMVPWVVASLQATRVAIRDALRVATLVGFGPRYLHSTGQLFKGGPNSGVFIQLTADAVRDLQIPGRRLTFGDVMAAQAAGDRRVLHARGRRIIHIHLGGALEQALRALDLAVHESLA